MCRMRRGFAIIEVLISLLVITAMIPVTIVCIRPFTTIAYFDEEIQDQIALSQLRRILLLSYDIECSPDEVDFEYQLKKRKLSFKNDHVVISDGTQIFFSCVDDAAFYQENQCVYIRYTRKNRTYEKVLCQTQ